MWLTAGWFLLAVPAGAVTIDWVTVGDPGNGPDTASNCFSENCGSVGYSYFLSKFEVTNAQYAEFLNAKAAEDPLELYNPLMDEELQGGITRSGNSGSFAYSVKPGFENKPVNYVSFFDALRFSNWLRNGLGGGDTETGAYTLEGGTAVPSNWMTVTRNAGAHIFLPSENEWYKAAYYDLISASYFEFPAGFDATITCTAPTAAPNSANCFGGIPGVTDVGAFAGSASPNGTFDQGGNVWEWNEEIALGSSRGLRGGNWGVFVGDLASSAPSSAHPSVERGGIGFRLASLVPEPGTSLLSMTSLAVLAALQWRRIPKR